MQIKQLLRDYTNWHEGSWSVEITHPSFESLNKQVQRSLEKVLYVLRPTDLQKAPEEYNEKVINCLRLIEFILREKNCTDQQLQALIVSSRLEIQQILDLPTLSDSQYAWLRESGLDRAGILKLVKDNNLSSVFNPFYDNLDSYKEALGLKDSDICNIIRLDKGFEKLEDLKNFCLKPTSQILNFKGSSNLDNLLIRSNWKDKLEYLSDVENLKRLKEFGFSGYDILILFKRDWRKKMDYFEDQSNVQWLKNAGYYGGNLYYIIMFPEWRKKLDYLNNYHQRLQKFKSAGFTPSDICKLLYPTNWRTEIKYIEDEKYLNRLKESGMTCSQIAQGWMHDWGRSKLKGKMFKSY